MRAKKREKINPQKTKKHTVGYGKSTKKHTVGYGKIPKKHTVGYDLENFGNSGTKPMTVFEIS